MVAAPQYATIVARGVKTGKTYNVDAYVSDVANAMVRFDAGAGAQSDSPDFYTFPEPVIITDFAIVTGTADTTKVRVVANGQPTGNVLRYTMHLTSIERRPALSIKLRVGTRFQLLQLA